MARQRKPFQPGLDPAAYNPIGLRAYSTEQLKAEYARIRPEAKARVDLLGRSKTARQSAAYRSNVGQYPTPKQIGDDRQALIHKITQAAQFVSAKSSTPKGQRDIRKKQVTSLHRNAGYDWVNESNFDEFTEFMEWLDARGEKGLFYQLLRASDEEDPESVEEAGEEMQEAFERWKQNRDEDPFDAMNEDEYDEDEDEEEEDLPEPEQEPEPQPKPRQPDRPKGEKYPAKKQPGRRGKQKKQKKQKQKKQKQKKQRKKGRK